MQTKSFRVSKAAPHVPAKGVHGEDLPTAVEAEGAALDSRDVAKASELAARPEGIEPPTLGLEGRGSSGTADRGLPTTILPRAALGAVSKVARLAPWIDRRDLEQEAHLATLLAAPTWREGGGSSYDQWIAYKVGLSLSRYMAEQRAPTSLPKHVGATWHRAASAARAELDDECPSAYRDSPEEALDTARAMAEVRRILDSQTEAARAVMLDQEKPASVAERLGLTVREVYRERATAMRALLAGLRAEAA